MVNNKETSVKLDSLLFDPSVHYTFYAPPPANWKIMFGDAGGFCIQVYIKNPPNRFQRWMITKVLGIRWESM